MLGFILNSKDIVVSPTQDKKDSTVALCSAILQRKTLSIRNVAQVLRENSSFFPRHCLGHFSAGISTMIKQWRFNEIKAILTKKLICRLMLKQKSNGGLRTSPRLLSHRHEIMHLWK